MQEKSISCYSCGNSWAYPPPLSRRSECPKCRRDAKVCRNCQFYDPGAHHECRESSAEWVKEKEKGNFCGYFEPSQGQSSAGAEQNKAKSQLDALFGGGDGDEDKPKQAGGLADELANFLDSKKT